MTSPTTSAGAHKVFVYGTLKRGLYNHRLLDRGNARFIGEARTKEKGFAMLLAKAGYPYLVRTTEDARVIDGELYAVDDATLEHLDVLEEIATGMYSREVMTVELLGEPSREEDAYFYLAGARDELNSLERIDSYTKEIHDEFYVPKNER